MMTLLTYLTVGFAAVIVYALERMVRERETELPVAFAFLTCWPLILPVLMGETLGTMALAVKRLYMRYERIKRIKERQKHDK